MLYCALSWPLAVHLWVMSVRGLGFTLEGKGQLRSLRSLGVYHCKASGKSCETLGMQVYRSRIDTSRIVLCHQCVSGSGNQTLELNLHNFLLSSSCNLIQSFFGKEQNKTTLLSEKHRILHEGGFTANYDITEFSKRLLSVRLTERWKRQIFLIS